VILLGDMTQISNREPTQRERIEAAIDRINRKMGKSFSYNKQLNGYRLTDEDGVREYSLRYSAKQLLDILRVIENILDA
jgi:hypothetical protein